MCSRSPLVIVDDKITLLAAQVTYAARFVDDVSLFDMGMRPGPSLWPPGSNPGRTHRCGLVGAWGANNHHTICCPRHLEPQAG